MALLLDVFGFLSVILRGLTVTAQSLTLGGIAFLILLAAPLAPELGDVGMIIIKRSLCLLRWCAISFAAIAAISVTIEAMILADSAGLTAEETIGANFVLAGAAIIAASIVIALVSRPGPKPPSTLLLLGLAAIILVAQTASSHAAARLDDRFIVGFAELVHQAGAAVWIGGIPYFLIALAQCRDGKAWRRVGKRYSLMSMASVAALVPAGIGMGVAYTGSIAALIGTSYGIMLGGKAALLCFLLVLGGMNFLLVERLRRDPG
ncbi:MAG: CopD family protein, partial [Alphaproteobacteria bacterium]|nr:CopD family protein [Alphaproteobacteria bacterium]